MKWLVVLLTLLALVAVMVAGVFFGLGYYLSPQDQLKRADAIVAISGGETYTRTDEAIELYKKGLAPRIIFSGAALDPNSPSNAATMAGRAREAGVRASDILLEEASTNTRENAVDVAAIMQDKNINSIILVTSPYHQRRAYITFRRALGSDVTIVNHSSLDQNWRRSHWWDTSYSRSLTLSESQKVLYELASDGSH